MKYLEVRKLTTNLMGCSMKTGKVGDESIITISGELRRKGTANIRVFRTNEPNSFGKDAQLNEADLQRCTASLRVASSDNKKHRPELGFPVISGGSKLGIR
jgi:hypothetical protein